MPVQRSAILRGPAIIQMGSQSIYAADKIVVTPVLETFPINVNTAGKVDERVRDIQFKISFTPVGEWETGLLSVFYPHTNPTMGSSLFGASDTPVIIHPVNGQEKITFAAGAVTKMPDLILSATKTAFGQMEITCIGADNTAWSNAARLAAITASAAFTDTAFSVTNVLTKPYTVSLVGESSPWDAINTREGVVVAFNMAMEPVMVDGEGVIDYTLSGLDVSVRFAPVSVTVAQMLTRLNIQGSGVAQGMSLSANASDILISAGSGLPEVTVYDVAPKTAPQGYDLAAFRHDEIELIATRPGGTGAIFAVGNAA